MNFEFSSDQMLLKDQARKFLESEESVKKAREVLEGQQTHDESLWKAVIEMGWTATTIPEEFDPRIRLPRTMCYCRRTRKEFSSNAIFFQCLSCHRSID